MQAQKDYENKTSNLTDISSDIPVTFPDHDHLPIEIVANTPKNRLRELAVPAGREAAQHESCVLIDFIGLLCEQIDEQTGRDIINAFTLGISSADIPPF